VNGKALGSSTASRGGIMDRLSAFMFVIAVALSTITSAQTRIGFDLGTQVSTLSRPTQGHLEWNWIGKASGGIAFDVAFAETFLLAAQVNFVQKWTGLNQSPFTEPASYIVNQTTLKAKYLEIPLYCRWRPINGTIRWFAEVGPKVSFLISARADISVAFGDCLTRDLNDPMSNYDIGLTVGSGLEFVVSHAMSLVLSAHYTHGLVPFFRESPPDYQWIGVNADCGVMFSL
jgi:hypothetical protein